MENLRLRPHYTVIAHSPDVAFRALAKLKARQITYIRGPIRSDFAIYAPGSEPWPRVRVIRD